MNSTVEWGQMDYLAACEVYLDINRSRIPAHERVSEDTCSKYRNEMQY